MISGMISGLGSCLILNVVILKEMNTSDFSIDKIKITDQGKSNGHKLWDVSQISKRDQKGAGTLKLKTKKLKTYNHEIMALTDCD